MTVARDAVLEFAEFTTTSPATLSFTPTGTPRAITVEIVTVEVDDSITGVTYGGVTMARVDSAAKSTPGEAGRSYTYFLGASIPTGTQTVSIAHDGSATQKWALVRSFTAGADTEVVTFNQLVGIQANPSIALDTGATESLRTAILYSGVGALSGFAELSGMEAVAAGEGNDFGNETAIGGVQTSASTGSFTIGWTAANDDVAMVAVAIQEVSGSSPQTISVGTATETETAKAVAVIATISIAVGTATETEVARSVASPLTAFPIRQQISHFLTGTSISGELRVTPIQDNIVFALFSAATTLANMGGPSGYTKAAEEEGDGISIQLWYKRAGAAESTTVTATSSASVALKIHVWESPGEMFAAGDPLDSVDTNDSSTSAVTTLSAGTTATTSQPNSFAIAAVAALGGNLDFRLVSWSDGFTAMSDHETLGLMGAYKVMTAAEAATATATWSQATTPTSHKAAGLVATFAMAVNLTVPAPAPRRVAFSTLRDVRNTTGTTDMVATFPVVQDHLYLAFVATSKLGGNNGNASIATSHGGTVTWTLAQSHFIGSSRRIHLFRALAASNQSAASLTITTPETTCAVWCLVLDVTGPDLSGTNGSGAIRQIAVDDETTGATFLEASFGAAPLATSGVVGLGFHGEDERQLIDDDPDVHLLFAESIMASEAQQATVDWFYGVDQTFRWDWATSIHALAIIAEIQIPSDAQTIAVGVANETETAGAVAVVIGAVSIAVGVATETESANTVGAAFLVPVGVANETETAGAVTAVPGTVTVTVGVASETETANAVAAEVAQLISVGVATEIETAKTVTPTAGAVTISVGTATETETAYTVDPVAQGGPQTISVAVAIEVETAGAVTIDTTVTIAVGAVSETETAVGVIAAPGAVLVSVGVASETETAGTVTPTSGSGITAVFTGESGSETLRNTTRGIKRNSTRGIKRNTTRRITSKRD